MVSEHSAGVARRAKRLYAEQLRETLEANHLHQFVAIEPDSGEYFIGETLSAAIRASRAAHPDRVTFAMRIGHDAAVHIGEMTP